MRPALILTLLAIALPASAQKSDTPHHRRAESVPHHAGMTADSGTMHDVPTGLSPDAVAGLLEGRGMGLAKAAELNHYPGPKHVLEHAAALDLTDTQQAEAERLMQSVQTESRVLGEQIVHEEHALDALFVHGRATPSLVDAATAEIGLLNGKLRAVHLRAHVAMREALTPEQIAAYDRLRSSTDG